MNLVEKRMYFIYVLLGSFYLISKVIYYSCGIVCIGGLILGLVASTLTIWIGISSFREYRKAGKPRPLEMGVGKPIAHWWAVIGPLIIILYSPLHMTIRLGIPVFQFPMGKFTILLIFECLAIAQLIIAVLMHKKLMLRRKEQKGGKL